MCVGDADTLLLNVAAGNLSLLAVNSSLPRAGEGDYGEIFSIHGATPSFFLVFDLLCTRMTELQCSDVDLCSFFTIKNMISLTPAYVNPRGTQTSGTDLQRGAALILRNKATALYSSENKGSRSGCNAAPLQRWASHRLSSFPLLPDFAAPTWEFLFLF